jgi:hypothetical protein
MFIFREYAACLLVALFAATLFLAACGIFLGLKAGGAHRCKNFSLGT